MLGPFGPTQFSPLEKKTMKRSVKLSIAAIATALVASLGIAGVAPSVEAGKVVQKDRNWCC
jgi:hypothetical protein